MYECSICHELLTSPAPEFPARAIIETVDDDYLYRCFFQIEPDDVSRIVATKCGHIFHKSCIIHWFQNSLPLIRCPICQRYGTIPKFFLQRIFPTSSTNNDRPRNVLKPESEETDDCIKCKNKTKEILELHTKDLKEKCNQAISVSNANISAELNLRITDMQGENQTLRNEIEGIRQSNEKIRSTAKFVLINAVMAMYVFLLKSK